MLPEDADAAGAVGADSGDGDRRPPTAALPRIRPYCRRDQGLRCVQPGPAGVERHYLIHRNSSCRRHPLTAARRQTSIVGERDIALGGRRLALNVDVVLTASECPQRHVSPAAPPLIGGRRASSKRRFSEAYPEGVQPTGWLHRSRAGNVTLGRLRGWPAGRQVGQGGQATEMAQASDRRSCGYAKLASADTRDVVAGAWCIGDRAVVLRQLARQSRRITLP